MVTDLIEETSGAEAKQLLISVTDYIGGDAVVLNSSLSIGAWSPTEAVDAAAFEDPVFNDSNEADPSDFATDQASGDDLLAAFLYNSYLDDTRNRYHGDDDEEATVAVPSVDYSAFAVVPGFSDFNLGSHTIYGDATSPYYYDEALRAKITEATPGYVGWRDHTDGHRITTTRGDKVEVIGGNYKLIVLGRGQGTVHTDWSGGHVVDTLEAAGNVTSINWRKVPVMAVDQDDDDDLSDDEYGWQWVEEVVKGNVIERFHGTTRNEFYGDKLITIIGSAEAPDIRDLAKAASDEVDLSEDDTPGHWEDAKAWSEGENFWDETFVSYAEVDEDDRTVAIPTRKLPKLLDRTYASSSYSFEWCKTDKIDVETGGTSVDDFEGCEPDGAVTTKDADAGGSWWAAALASTDDYVNRGVSSLDALKAVKLKSSKPKDGPELRRTTEMAKNIREHTMCNTFVEERNCDLYVGNYSAADKWGSHVVESWFGNTYEHFSGARESFFLGMNQSSTCGPLIPLAAIFQWTLFGAVDVVAGWCFEANLKKSGFTIKETETAATKVEAAINRTVTTADLARSTLVDVETMLVETTVSLMSREP